jgi:hypothetical protein
MTVGLKGYQNDASLGLAFMLAQPFLPEPKEQPATAAPLQEG